MKASNWRILIDQARAYVRGYSEVLGYRRGVRMGRRVHHVVVDPVPRCRRSQGRYCYGCCLVGSGWF